MDLLGVILLAYLALSIALFAVLVYCDSRSAAEDWLLKFWNIWTACGVVGCLGIILTGVTRYFL